MQKLNIMIVGVGGQGTLLTSRVIGNAALKESYDVKVSEVHGMAQRGGSVVTYVKMGSKVYSPIIEKGMADIILAFEQLEALRWIEYLKKDGRIIINKQEIDPMPVITGKEKYPERIIQKIIDMHNNVLTIDALSIARQCGNIKAVNMVMLGAMAKHTSISKETWISSMKEIIPQRFIDLNIDAFEEGYAII
ncbi:MAG: indolepyruvate oxidoreductase subunit beta [Acetivibrionales bacterium]|jgi:indolepyruvate ferredoxin oxidoreductase beta subunit